MTKPLVLIIDDVPDNVQLLGETLSGMCRVQFAASGEEGLQLIQAQRPDLVLLDVMMPGMSGYEVFARLRADDMFRDIPVVFVTAKSDAKSESEAILAGAADFIHKPINLDVVRARVRMQLELAMHRTHLEQLVLARTRELATARAEAESASAVKTRFMANVSHEMRTPLVGILGFSELGKLKVGKATDDAIRGYFDKIGQSGKRLHGLTESLLSLTEEAWKEQSGIDDKDLQALAPELLASECIRMMEKTAANKQQKIAFENHSTIEVIQGDEARLRQMLEHLLSNALRFSPRESTVTVRIQDIPAASGDPSKVKIEVIDQGCGIPEKEMGAIFEPFYESSRTATGAGGTGLGLPLCKNIVHRHKGGIAVSNRAEGGAIFEITLPKVQG